ncbi:MAG: hypothetical protein KDE27_22615 [Planctomycetes bacterium]|nr:hypothetical protein [Planctomycetota bacterium]
MIHPCAALLAFVPLPMLSAQDIVDLPWRETDRGLLEVRIGDPPTGSAGEEQRPPAEWRTMFPGLFAPWFDGTPSILGGIAGSPPFDALPLLLHGAGGAAALDEWARRLQKLGVRVSVDTAAMRRVAPDPLLDLLRVRHLESADTYAAMRVLVAYALDPARDPFTRAAAAEAVARSGMAAQMPEGAEVAARRLDRPGAAGLQSGSIRIPDDADLVIGLHSAALPSAAGLLTEWRRLQHLWLSSTVADQGESASPARFVDAQLRMDQPGQLPYELAARFGNWRVDYALFAVRCDAGNSCWFHLAGAFQPQRLADGARAAGIEDVVCERGEVRAALDGWQVRCTPLEFEAWQGDLDGTARGGRDDLPGADDAPVWAIVAPGSRLGESMGLGRAGLTARFAADLGALSAVSDPGDAAVAERLLTRWNDWQAARSLQPDWSFPNFFAGTWQEIAATRPGLNESGKIALSWLRCVGAVVTRREGTRVEWQLDLTKFAALDLVRLLATDPLFLLQIERPR